MALMRIAAFVVGFTLGIVGGRALRKEIGPFFGVEFPRLFDAKLFGAQCQEGLAANAVMCTCGRTKDAFDMTKNDMNDLLCRIKAFKGADVEELEALRREVDIKLEAFRENRAKQTSWNRLWSSIF